MKKPIVLPIAALMLAASLAGCTSAAPTAAGQTTPAATPEATASQEASTATPAATESATQSPDAAKPTETATAQAGQVQETADGVVYTSPTFHISFTMPKSWAGKFNVVESDRSLVVHFKPAASIEDGKGGLFTILKKTSDDDKSFFDNEQEITVGDATYLVGTPTGVTYSDTDPEYSTYAQMCKDIPAIEKTIQAAK